jgi:hypothetical protein
LRWLSERAQAFWQLVRAQGLLWLEVGVVVVWGLYVTKPYLNLDPTVWPTGSDFPRNIQLFFEWRNLPVCGACVFWNGSINGGAPAFADNFTPVLYPPLIFTTLIWGTINGAKLTLVFSFILAGLAQWWLARVLGLGRVARLWSALMAVAGGQLSSRMQMGHIVMVTSVSAASLVLAPALQTALTGGRRPAILFGLTMALALVSGHGYIQVAILLGLLPALLIFTLDEQLHLRWPIIKAFALAAGLTLLVAAVYWLPLSHFWSTLSKQGDLNFSSGVPVVYALMNLVIDDLGYFNTEILYHSPFPAFFMMYISWVPIVLAIVAVRLVRRPKLKVLVFCLLAILLIYYVSSAQFFRLTQDYIGSFFAAGRSPSLMAPLAVPLILLLAAWGLDELLKRKWPRLTFGYTGGGTLSLPLVALLALPLLWALHSVYVFGTNFIGTTAFPSEDWPIAQFVPDTTQWVAIPYGDLNYLPKAIDGGLKIIVYPDFTAWNWADRDAPPPFRELTPDQTFVNDPSYLKTVQGMVVLEHPENQYAAIVTPAGDQVACTATATGGNVDVTCPPGVAGLLTVQENQWPGWSARVEGGPTLPLVPGTRLAVQLPNGASHISFRYRPWDVTIGLLLMVLGLVVALRLWSGPAFGWRDPDGPGGAAPALPPVAG